MPSTPDFSTQYADLLNRQCFCIGTDVPGLYERMQGDLAKRGIEQSMLQSHPHLFSSAPVFIASSQITQMREVVQAIESVLAMPQFHIEVLASAPAIAQRPQSPLGVFMGYDFHVGTGGVRLIEINTNAGGAFLNVAMMQAQQACCEGVENFLGKPIEAEGIENRLLEMFRNEWKLARGSKKLERIAIVDTMPEEQYLYPEFLLFKNMMESDGIEVVITDPSGLWLDENVLLHASGKIDLVYNRLTDFYFEAPGHANLREAYAVDAAVFTPHPYAHAIYANKRNLSLLSDAAKLAGWDVPQTTIDILMRNVPRTLAVTQDNADTLWNDRKNWFFKPTGGFGSRGAYRGDKMTTKVFSQIRQGDYVAQQLVPPSGRTARLDSGDTELKLDVRAYVYEGEVQLLAARLYQGQTTNFRTPGGGFAPVYAAPEDTGSCRADTNSLRDCASFEKNIPKP
ncbi:MAG: hypothetical protein ABI644_08375 [Arenimonas sp.]